jgi:beta-lactamase class A
MRRVALSLALALLLAACATRPEPLPPAPAGPVALQSTIDELARGFDGRVGIAVQDVGAGWAVGHDADGLYPQQSVAKLWVALTVFDAVEKGRMKLDDPVLVTRNDMSVFNQPIRKLLTDQGYQTTVDGLLVLALAQSDNAANDILLKRAGGPAAVRRALEARHILGIRASPPEQVLESHVAAVRWKPEYSFGQAFWTARDKVTMPKRIKALQHYLDDPADGAAPRAITDALARLKRGELLGPAMTARFLEILAKTTTGPARLPGGLAPGWSIAHKTGTGQDLGDLSTGYNDVGLITAPNGHVYTAAVMIAATHRPIPERQALMVAVTRALVAEHDGATAPAAQASGLGSSK